MNVTAQVDTPRANAAMVPFLRRASELRLGSAESVMPVLAVRADRLIVKDGRVLMPLGGTFVVREGMPLPSEESIKKSFMDWTGFECFANNIHLEDLMANMDAVEMLGQAIGFAKLIQAKLPTPALPLRFIAGLDKFNGLDQCDFRFHVIRPSESWLAEDIEGYSEPTLTWTFSESPL